MTAEKILEIARREIGAKESPAGSNRVKYNTAYYGREISGSKYAWCAVFVWWCFRQAGAAKLYYGGKKTAYCPALLAFHQKQGVSGVYKPGDIIFFNFSGKTNAAHVGICESWDGQYITTIDGNTGSGNDANGGAVMRRKRDKKYIVGAYRPRYEEENSMLTYEQWKEYMARYQQELAETPDSKVPAWAKAEMEKAKNLGICDGSRPLALVSRAEAASMIVRAKN